MRAEKEFWEGTEVQRPQRLDYLGALIREERRLVLVPLDPREPWEAFRKMRSWMRVAKKPAEVDVFESPQPIQAAAKIISLDTWRAKASEA